MYYIICRYVGGVLFVKYVIIVMEYISDLLFGTGL